MTLAISRVYSADSGAIGLPMPAETKTKPKQGTWRDWLPDGTPDPDEGELLTREDVLAHAARLGASVTESEFRYWTALGVLPGPVRQWFRGATRATYPNWVVLVVYAARELHRQGVPLPAVGTRLRGFAFREGPEKFLENFILMELFGPIGAAARHLRLQTEVTYNRAEVTFTRDGDPNTATTIGADLLL